MIENMFNDTSSFQIAFYIISPIATFLAVGTAYLAVYRQSKPNILLYYEPSHDAGSIIDLVICNHGTGTARDLEFSDAIPILCWGIEKPQGIDKSKFLKLKIPVLAPGKELRYQAGQYGGLLSEVGEQFSITATYKYRTPLRSKKLGDDTSILDIKYMANMHSGNSAAQDLSDALKGRNNTIFSSINGNLKSIDGKLDRIASALEGNENT